MKREERVRALKKVIRPLFDKFCKTGVMLMSDTADELTEELAQRIDDCYCLDDSEVDDNFFKRAVVALSKHKDILKVTPEETDNMKSKNNQKNT